MKKKIIFRSLLGAPVGVTISLIITIIFSLSMGHGEYFPAPHELIDWCGGNATTAVIVQFIGSLAIGALMAASSVIWEIERISLTKQTLLHFAVVVVTFFPISYLLNWLPHNLYGALGFAAAFIGMYVIMWISIYFSIKAKIKKMNKQLQEMHPNDTQN